MRVLEKPLDAIDEDDLRELIAGKVSERLRLDYKSKLPGVSKEEHRKFLNDVTSFANAVGGVIFYGMHENAGVPISLEGIRDANPDREISRLEQMLLSGVEPRIRGVEISRVLVGSAGGFVLVVRIRQSSNAPHMVKFDDSQRFYARRTTGKFLLDVAQIRSAFLASEGEANRIRGFRLDRIAKIVAGDTPVGLPGFRG